jgi:TIR domain
LINKAFISYSHLADADVARAIQSALEQFAKPWYRLRAFRLFRDTTNLSLAPELWPEIEKALSESEFLLFLASSKAAKSKWVKKELLCWLERKDASKLLLILTDGEILWDDALGDFDWRRTTSIPEVLRGVFPQEPLYLDFTQLRGDRLSINDGEFLDHIATIAAPLHGRSKDEIYGEHIRQHRKTMQLAWSAVISLVALTLTAFWLFGVAEIRREQAEQETRVATAQRLGAQSELVLTSYPERSLQLATEAFRVTEQKGESRVGLAEEALREALTSTSGIGFGRHPREDSPKDVDTVSADCSMAPLGGFGYRGGNPASREAFSPASRYLLMLGRYEKDRLLAISPSGRWLLTMGDNALARLWDLSAKDPARSLVTFHDSEKVLTASFSPDDRWLVTGGWQGRERGLFFNPYRCHVEEGQKTVRLWDLTS